MKNHFFLNFYRGFSIIELLVTIAIFTLITGVVLTRQGEFNNGILLTNLAYEVALTVRQAQVYGLGIRSAGLELSDFQRPYGVNFNEAYPQNFIFFADDGDFRYLPPPAGVDLTLETMTLRKDMSIGDFCARLSSTHQLQCKSSGTLSRLDILFQRPNPDAHFVTNIVDSQTIGSNFYEEALIYVRSSGGAENVITVSRTGQISVSRTEN